MTVPPEARDNTSSAMAHSQLSGDVLLHQLLAEIKASQSGDKTPDLKQIRHLLQGLFELCIMTPSRKHPSQSVDEHVKLTLAVIERHCMALPRLIRPSTSEGGASPSFVDWTLPRLISAAASFGLNPQGNDVYETLIEGGIRLIRLLEHEPASPLKHARRWGVLRELLTASTASAGSVRLYGYNLSMSTMTRLSLLDIGVRLYDPFDGPFGKEICLALSSLHEPVLDSTVQGRYAGVVKRALLQLHDTSLLRSACVYLIEVGELGNNLIDAINRQDAFFRFDCWKAMSRRSSSMTVKHDSSSITFLLQPIHSMLSAEHVRELLPSEDLTRWEREIRESSVPESSLRWILLGCENDISNTSNKKRKRNDEDAAFAKVQACLKDIRLSEPHWMEELLAELKGNADLSDQVCAALQQAAPHLPPSAASGVLDIWVILDSRISRGTRLWPCLFAILSGFGGDLRKNSRLGKVIDIVEARLGSKDRHQRVLAGRALCTILQLQVPSLDSDRLCNRLNKLLASSPACQATTLSLIGAIGRQSEEGMLLRMIEFLVQHFGSPNSAIRSMALAEMLDIAGAHGKTPFAVVQPFLDRLSIIVAQNLRRRPDVVAEVTALLGLPRQGFVRSTLPSTLPALVVARDKDALLAIASIVNQDLGPMLLDYMAEILTHIFLSLADSDSATQYLVELFADRLDSRTANHASVGSLIASCHMNLAVALIIELGDEDPKVSQAAAEGLRKAHKGHSGSVGDIADFLKPVMLGIMTHLNETLHDMRGRKSVGFKQKLVRSLAVLIRLFGKAMAAYSPQVIASLQSTLSMSELRDVTLDTWTVFIDVLPYEDIGPFIGRTVGALVASWTYFNHGQARKAIAIVEEITGNLSHFKRYAREIVDISRIVGLEEAARRLSKVQAFKSPADRMLWILDRASNQNIAIATLSMQELRDFLDENGHLISTFSAGDSFDQQIPAIMRVLLSGAMREGNCSDLRLAAYECLGIIGALDPHRFNACPDPPMMTIVKDFADHQESVSFAIHLIRDVLVGAFRGTNDTKFQSHLAYAIQELLAFCGFTQKVLSPKTPVPAVVRDEWDRLPKDQIEVLAPLLESRFKLGKIPPKDRQHPIYVSSITYRDWLIAWTTELIDLVMLETAEDSKDCRTIFQVFRGVLRNDDLAVASALLPHLVLHIILSNNKENIRNIRLEMVSVLEDQVNSRGAIAKRTLSAQLVFDLMDHLSRYTRLRRDSEKSTKGRRVADVESLLSGMGTELIAHAALRSKAYARSLRNFEERMVELRAKNRPNEQLQTYFERLHELYAELDEPDGMEGISTFVIAPTLDHQIREHESTGQWTSAQSCWEIKLQREPEEVALHIGMLKCLQNLGHYDTLRTHIRGVLSRHPEWATALAPYQTDAAWMTSDWETLSKLGTAGRPFGPILLGLREKADLRPALQVARAQVGQGIVSKNYGRMYQSILQLHQIRDIELIHAAANKIVSHSHDINKAALSRKCVQDLTQVLSNRFAAVEPSFRSREAVLAIRRTTFDLVAVPDLANEVGRAWIKTSSIARKAGYEQTAYTAALQASGRETPFAFIQQAKLQREHDGAFKALTRLQSLLAPMTQQGENDLGQDSEIFNRHLAKATLLEARLARDTDRFEFNEVVDRFKSAIKMDPHLESPFFDLGHYYDTAVKDHETEQSAAYNVQTCHNYIQALKYGVKYIYQTMPRMLTLWLDLAEQKDWDKGSSVARDLNRITLEIDRARRELPAYQFLTAFPQLVSRLGHPNKDIKNALSKIIATVIAHHPRQAIWPMVGIMQSKRQDRKLACEPALNKAQKMSPSVTSIVQEANRLSSALLRLAEDQPSDDKRRELSCSTAFPYIKAAVPNKMIIPLQEALTCTLPVGGEGVQTHNPFPNQPVEIAGVQDRIDVMPSLQRPKKLTLVGSDGKNYPFLCKPHDDLRKDARLMDFNSMINKLLKRGPESRRRRLYIRTYAVMPLNEECGLLEWVGGTHAFKRILEHQYARVGKKIYLHNLLGTVDKKDPAAPIKMFKEQILPMFSPTVFQNWFLQNWPEPTAWLISRTSYSRTLAVMSMIGYVLGLGDRHGENILFDGATGDTVHVDLNCLFEKGKTFQIPERVPFRLTHNMVDALGVTGVEGIYRKAAEVTMSILRDNTDSLMSVLEAFAHDPLVEWSAKGGKARAEKDIRTLAEKNLKPIRAKLQGQGNGMVNSVPRQTDMLIKEATSPSNLAVMYQGWAPYL